MEAEYVAAGEAAKELKYLTMTLTEVHKSLNLNIPILKPLLYMDNTAAISFITKPATNISTRYIDLDYHFVRDYYESGEFEIKHVPSKLNLADILTKSLPRDSFLKLRGQLLQ